MFTAENFRRIYDLENRKGNDLAGHYFPDLEPYTQSVYEKVQAIRDLRSKSNSVPQDQFYQALNALRDQLNAAKSEKSAAVDGELAAISNNVAASGFSIKLSQKTGPKGKSVYCIDGTPETFFTVKQLQRNLFNLYGVKQANRHDLVCQVRDTIIGGFPFEIIRTDISSFYESIERKYLVEQLERDQLLSAASRKFLRQVLESYGRITGSGLGVPRGVGISAYLAELYLRPIDRKIKKLPGLVMYGRYVDDIVAIFARPPAGEAPASYLNEIKKILELRGLLTNASKTKFWDMQSQGVFKFEYLGYRFHVTAKSCEISPSANKIRKYRDRLEATFQQFNSDFSINSKRAFRELVARIKFLTGNTRLANSKSQALTGIFFSNSLVTDTRSFTHLDKILVRKISSLPTISLSERIQPLSFVSGFNERRFHNFSTHEMKNIVKAWKHG